MILRLFITALLSVMAMQATAKSWVPDTPLLVVYKLHGQTRKYQYTFTSADKGLTLAWGIERNTQWQSGSFTISAEALKNADKMSFLQPIDGEHISLPDDMTYLVISDKAYADLVNDGAFTYNNTEFKATGRHEERDGYSLTEAHDSAEGCTLWILDREGFHLIWQMADNPLEINWTVSPMP